MNIAPNPSHLETVGAVVEGITRQTNLRKLTHINHVLSQGL